jgi:hypothetical protein
MMTRHRLISAAVGALAAAAVLVPASASGAPARDRPPECVLVQMVAPSGHTAWVDACGGAGGQESWAQDWLANAARQPVTFDGFWSISPRHCPRSSPCVVLAENAPQS